MYCLITRFIQTDERESLAYRSAAFEILPNNFEYVEVDCVKNCLRGNVYLVERPRIVDIENKNEFWISRLRKFGKVITKTRGNHIDRTVFRSSDPWRQVKGLVCPYSSKDWITNFYRFQVGLWVRFYNTASVLHDLAVNKAKTSRINEYSTKRSLCTNFDFQKYQIQENWWRIFI